MSPRDRARRSRFKCASAAVKPESRPVRASCKSRIIIRARLWRSARMRLRRVRTAEPVRLLTGQVEKESATRGRSLLTGSASRYIRRNECQSATCANSPIFPHGIPRAGSRLGTLRKVCRASPRQLARRNSARTKKSSRPKPSLWGSPRAFQTFLPTFVCEYRFYAMKPIMAAAHRLGFIACPGPGHRSRAESEGNPPREDFGGAEVDAFSRIQCAVISGVRPK